MAVSYVDVAKRAPASAELRRLSRPAGARALLDDEAKAFREAGLAYLRMSDDEILERLVADPRMLRLPLVRMGSEVTVGLAEETWRDWQRRT
jgi:arsenate reductase-like glutaredoxin family protein